MDGLCPDDFFVGMKTYIPKGREDRRGFFGVTIDTLLSTTGPKNPVVILDDCSPCEQHKKRLTALEGEQGRVQVISLAKNKGVAAAQNRLLFEFMRTDKKAAVLIDDDVAFSPNWLASCCRRMNSGKKFEHSAALIQDHPGCVGGYLLTFTREVCDIVGGFDETVCPYGGEHEWYSRRAERAGFSMPYLSSMFRVEAEHLAWQNASNIDAKRYREARMEEVYLKFKNNFERYTHIPILGPGMNWNDVSFICPIYHRPKEACEMIKMIDATRTENFNLEKILVWKDPADVEQIKEELEKESYRRGIQDWKLIYDHRDSSVQSSERGLMQAKNRLVIWWNDDAIPDKPETFIQDMRAEYLKRFGDGDGILGLNDQALNDPAKDGCWPSGGAWASFGIGSKNCYIHYLKMYPTPYLRYAWDNEIKERAESLGLWHYAKDLIVWHNNAIKNKAVQNDDKVRLEKRRKEWAESLKKKDGVNDGKQQSQEEPKPEKKKEFMAVRSIVFGESDIDHVISTKMPNGDWRVTLMREMPK